MYFFNRQKDTFNDLKSDRPKHGCMFSRIARRLVGLDLRCLHRKEAFLISIVEKRRFYGEQSRIFVFNTQGLVARNQNPKYPNAEDRVSQYSESYCISHPTQTFQFLGPRYFLL